VSVQTIRRAATPSAIPHRRLRLLPPPRTTPRRGRGLFALILVGVLVCGLVGLLLLNTVLAQQSFALHDLQRSQTVLDDTERLLVGQLDAASGPQALAAAALAQGLVPGCDAAFVKATAPGAVSGVLVGTATTVTGIRHGSLLVVAAAPGPVVPCVGTPAAQQAAREASAAAQAGAPVPTSAAGPALAAGAAPGAGLPGTVRSATVARPTATP
jgi:hypothetical protein